MALRKSIVWVAVAFGMTLALVVGIRLDQAALATVVGVGCGIGASVPASLFVLYLMRRRDQVSESRWVSNRRREMYQSPPVVVVSPPMMPQLSQPAAWSTPSGTMAPKQREFVVIGEEGIRNGVDYWQE